MKLCYEQRGEGRDLLFLHGYLACKETFAPQIAYFSRHFRVTALDFPGFGGAEPLPAAWSVGDYADWTQNAMDALGISKPLVVAHSFGGRVAVKCLSRGDVFERAVLTGCAGIVERRTLSYHVRVRAYRFVRAFAPKFAARRFGSREYRTLPPLMRESYKKIVNEDLTPCLAGIRVPVLYVFGDKDTATPPYMAEVLHKNTAGSGLVYMKGCSHFCFCERPDEFNAIAREFLL